jgi:hypothetical protein
MAYLNMRVLPLREQRLFDTAERAQVGGDGAHPAGRPPNNQRPISESVAGRVPERLLSARSTMSSVFRALDAQLTKQAV